MQIVLWCILASAMLPILAAFPAKTRKGFDNSRPRDAAFWASGFPARARGAMENGFEAFPFFAVAALAGVTLGGSVDWIAPLAIAFVGARIAYTVAYWTDRATLRSVVWVLGFGLSAAILMTPIWAPASAA